MVILFTIAKTPQSLHNHFKENALSKKVLIINNFCDIHVMFDCLLMQVGQTVLVKVHLAANLKMNPSTSNCLHYKSVNKLSKKAIAVFVSICRTK